MIEIERPNAVEFHNPDIPADPGAQSQPGADPPPGESPIDPEPRGEQPGPGPEPPADEAPPAVEPSTDDKWIHFENGEIVWPCWASASAQRLGAPSDDEDEGDEGTTEYVPLLRNGVVVPTPEEIAARAAEIIQEWSAAERLRRMGRDPHRRKRWRVPQLRCATPRAYIED
jgi:hypothetical protein